MESQINSLSTPHFRFALLHLNTRGNLILSKLPSLSTNT